MMMDIQAIAFDLDGTLIDSLRDLAASVNFMLADIGLPERTLKEIKGFVGDGVAKLIARALGESHKDRQEKALRIFLGHYGEHLTDTTRLYPGVAEVLETLRLRYRLAVVTNKRQSFSTEILRRLGVAQYFDLIIGGDSLPEKKPDPAPLLYLAARWHITPAQILMVGDHATDIEAGSRAGCRTVHFAGGIGETRGLRPDASIGAMAELPGLLPLTSYK